MQFTDLPLDHRIQKSLQVKGFSQATEIQQKAIPHALLGKDLLASSKTGSGKTLAFLLPALHRVLKTKAISPKDPRVLILAPTRELAKQVFMELKWLLASHGAKACLILGGENYNDQVKTLKRNPQFVVGTAGRVADHLANKSLFLNGLELLIMDEADRMLDLGFKEQLLAVHEAADHRKRQTMMFSATLESAAIHRLTQTLLNAPERISIGQANEEHKDIDQSFVFADHIEHKDQLLLHVAKNEQYQQMIVFCATRADSERLANLLNEHKHDAIALHADLPQNQRSNIMQSFSRGQQSILVTTDVASRGLDLLSVSLVVNFDLPKFTDEYVHRVGRTGRAGNQGKGIAFVGPKDWRSYCSIEHFLQQAITFTEYPDLVASFKGNPNHKMHKGKPLPKKSKSKSAKKPSKPAAAKKRVKVMEGSDIGDAPLRRKKPS